MRRTAAFFTSFLLGGMLHAQNDSTKTDSIRYKQRRAVVWTANIALPVATHVALYSTWYRQYPQSKFHWINDNGEWIQVDKAGHFFSTYFIAAASAMSFRHAGYSRRKSALIGTGVALGFQTAIEYFDGRSAGWGASSGDLLANAAGAIFGGAQNFIWGKVKVPVRLTLRRSGYAPYRPEVLGKNLPERMLKDYNGQTYWIDFNPRRMGIQIEPWPKWLGISLGYGAEGMLGGYGNIWHNNNGDVVDMTHIPRYRQFLVGPSIGLGHLKPKNKALRILCLISEYWRIPLPAVEFNSLGNVKCHWIY